ncbi:hypothetical protein ACP6ET_27600, partial [Klebsiella quasipneumoniae]
YRPTVAQEMGGDHSINKADDTVKVNNGILHLENELSVVIYHISQPETLPVTMPLGFITTNKKSVKIIGALITEYLKSSSGFDKPHDCGFLSSIVEKC